MSGFEVREIGPHRFALGDCLEVMAAIEDQSIDLVLADLPYGTTYAKWDSVIPADQLWSAYRRIMKPQAAIVLTASQPFTSMLIASNPAMFRCEWIWDKQNPTNFANANRQPMKVHESVLIFGNGQTTYNPQKVPGKTNHIQGKRGRNRTAETQLIDPSKAVDNLTGLKFPRSIVEFPKHSSQCKFHPTQKPVDLLRYFIRSYSNPGEVVLDNTMGSGSSGVAAVIEGRLFKGIEKDPAYFEIACERVAEAIASSAIPSSAGAPNASRSA